MKKTDTPPVVFLLGPTAAGKTELAAALSDAFDAELVSVDAAQVWRGMDIGTGKPSPDFLHRYPHHLINIRAPDEVYDAAQFCADARGLIARIHAAGKLPVLVGGTMFYFAALENGLSVLPSADADTRRRLTDELKRDGLPAMHEQLRRADPDFAATIKPSDTQRILRALEIYRVSGKPPSEVMASSSAEPLPHPIIKIGLHTAERTVLHRRIEARLKKMLARGLVDEVKTVAAGLDDADHQPSMRTVNYRQVRGYLRGDYDLKTMTDKAAAATRQLAKRQLTWMRRWDDLEWIDNTDDATATVCSVLRNRLKENADET